MTQTVTARQLSESARTKLAFVRSCLLGGFLLDEAELMYRDKLAFGVSDFVPKAKDVYDMATDAPGQLLALGAGALLPGVVIGGAAGYGLGSLGEVTEDDIEDVQHREKMQAIQALTERIKNTKAIAKQRSITSTSRRLY